MSPASRLPARRQPLRSRRQPRAHGGALPRRPRAARRRSWHPRAQPTKGFGPAAPGTSLDEWSGFPVWSAIIDRSLVDYPAEDVLLVEDPGQLRALGGDLRGRIIGLLRESARSTQQLSIELGIPKGTVGHHLKVLEKAGLIRVVHERKVRAVTEKFYGRVARLFVFQIEDPADARQAGASMLREAAFQLERTSGEGAAWGLVLSRLTPKDAKRFGRRVDRLFEDFRVSDAPDGTPHRLAMAYFVTEPRDA